MKRRDNLLRLKRFRVEDLKRRLMTLDDMKANLERKLEELDQSIEREKARASDSDIGRLAFPSFLQAIEVRRKNICSTMKEVERERAGVQDDMTEAYQDLKSFEVAEEERQRRAEDAAAHAGQIRLDELAVARHFRKHSLRRA